MDYRHYLTFRKSRSAYSFTVVLLSVLWMTTAVQCLEYRRVSRKLHSSPEPLDTQLSNEDLRHLLSILEDNSKEVPYVKNDATTEKASVMQHNAMILPELIRSRPVETTTTTQSPVARVTTRRFYRRLRRKTSTTEAPSTTTPATTLREASDVESARMLPTGSSPGDILQQLSLLNGILGALNSTAQAPTPAHSSATTANANINATPVPDFLALFTGAKSGEASSKSEVVVPPPPASPSPAATQDDPAAALALLNLFSNGGNPSHGKETSDNGNNAANNLLSLVAQSQQAAMQPAPLTGSDNDATAAALTKLLLQSSVPNNPAMQGNSIVQSQAHQNHDASASQVHNLLGLLGTLGAASQQSQTGNINQFFNQGGDQVAQAQTTNSLAHLFGQQSQQQAQAQNLLSLLGGNQGNQGFNLASLIAPQAGNSIPGLGLLSTMSSLGSSIFSTVSNIFGGSTNGQPRVRGKGVDTRVGLGYRLGNIGDAQVVWDIGPQLFTDPLRNEVRQYTQKRESSGTPAAVAHSHYFQSPSATATEKEVQQIEAKRRMVQAAIQDHYRGDHFASVYPKPQASQRRSHSHYDYTGYSHYYPEHPKSSFTSTKAPTSTSTSSSIFGSLPFADHFKGFWTGLTNGFGGNEKHEPTSKHSHYYNFDDVRSDFSANLIKRSSPDYTEYQSRALNARQTPEDADVDDPTHSTLTEYERMLLHYGKDIGVANTKHGVIEDEPQASESGFFSRWFNRPSGSTKPVESRMHSAQQSAEWGFRSNSNHDNNFSKRNPNSQTQKSVKKSFSQPSPPSPPASPSSSPFGYDGSFLKRNNPPQRRKGPRPPKRKSHNPFRNWIVSLKQSAQRPRASHPSVGFGRRHFKRPSPSGNPKLQHFTNTNKDLMMADANNDDFVESAGVESYQPGYNQPIEYNYANEFPDVSLTMAVPPRRSRPKNKNNFPSKVRATLSQRENIVEPALLYDHLEVTEGNVLPEVEESFHQRNKVVVNSRLKEREKQKVLGTVPTPVKAPLSTLTKIQRLRLQNKLRTNSTGVLGKQKIVVKIKANKGATFQQAHVESPSLPGRGKIVSESTTALPSMLSTISSLFSGTTKPKLFNNLLYNATSMFPSISSLSILPKKRRKEQAKTKLTVQNGRPAVVAIPDPESEDDFEDDQETAADGDEAEPVVQVGHDMTFADLQTMFAGVKKNGTKKRRFRIRVKESVLKGESKDKNDKERKESDEDEEENARDIFVDIESGEVSVLKPVASLVSFSPKKEEASDEEEIDYYEDDDGDGVADADMNRKQHIFEAIQSQLVTNFEKMKKAQLKAEAKKRRKQELAEKGMDESIDAVMKYFEPMEKVEVKQEAQQSKLSKLKNAGGLSM